MPNIFDLAVKRDWKQGLLFYVVYLLMLLVTCGILGTVAAAIAYQYVPDQEFLKKVAKETGQLIAVIGCPLLAALIIRTKKIQDPKILIPFFGTIILAFLGGGILGLILPAYLTTRAKA